MSSGTAGGYLPCGSHLSCLRCSYLSCKGPSPRCGARVSRRRPPSADTCSCMFSRQSRTPAPAPHTRTPPPLHPLLLLPPDTAVRSHTARRTRSGSRGRRPGPLGSRTPGSSRRSPAPARPGSRGAAGTGPAGTARRAPARGALCTCGGSAREIAAPESAFSPAGTGTARDSDREQRHNRAVDPPACPGSHRHHPRQTPRHRQPPVRVSVECRSVSRAADGLSVCGRFEQLSRSRCFTAHTRQTAVTCVTITDKGSGLTFQSKTSLQREQQLRLFIFGSLNVGFGTKKKNLFKLKSSALSSEQGSEAPPTHAHPSPTCSSSDLQQRQQRVSPMLKLYRRNKLCPKT